MTEDGDAVRGQGTGAGGEVKRNGGIFTALCLLRPAFSNAAGCCRRACVLRRRRLVTIDLPSALAQHMYIPSPWHLRCMVSEFSALFRGQVVRARLALRCV